MKTKSLLIILLILSFFPSQVEGKDVYNGGSSSFARKALVAPDCLINDLISVVKVGSGTNGMNNLLDENLDNYAELSGLAGVGTLVDPIVRVKDRKYYYPAGTTAGFAIQTEAGSKLLSLNLLKGMSIMLYKDGTLQETIVVQEGQASVLSLNLIQIGGTSNEVTSFLTVKSTKQFDEIGIVSTGVDVDVLSAMKLKYAFVGEANDIYLTTTNLPGIKASGASTSTNKYLIDDDLTNYATVTAILLDLGATISLEWSEDNAFPKGSKIGFKFKDANLLNLGITNTFTIKLTGPSGSEEVRINTDVLKLDLIGTSGEKDVSVSAPIKFNKAELVISGLGVSVKARDFYYGYVQEPPLVAHNHNLGLSSDATICDNETTYQLTAKETVTWKVKSVPAGETIDNIAIAADGKVTGMKSGVTGDYVFTATAADGCTGDITIHKGVSYTIDPGCNEAISPQEVLALSTEIHGLTGSLISISDLENKQNIIDNSLYTYAEYTGGLSIADNIEITGIKRTDGQVWKSDATGSRVGFAVEASSTFLNADALHFFRVRLYNSKTQTWVVSDGVIDNSNIVSAGLIGSEKSFKVRYSIPVPANTEFDEITLWKSGVLTVGLSTLRIYGAFMENASANCYNDPLGCSSEMITADKGASINYDATGISGLVNAAGTILDLEKLIDNNVDTYTNTNGIAVGASTAIAVKLGREYNKTHQIGIIIDKATYLAGVNVADWMTVQTYYKGTATNDKQTGWSVLGLDAIGYGDKTYLILHPTLPYDEIRINMVGLADVLDATKLYGIFVRNDADADGIPDCSDENSCPDNDSSLTDVKFDASDICAGNTLTLTGKGTAGKTYTISSTAENIGTLTFTVGADGTFSWTSNALTTAGRLFTLTITDEGGRMIENLPFTVHPLETTWKTSPVDTDWNNWDNWTNGSPLTCTNVIIPSACSAYPILTSTDAEANGCNNIHFESDAEVVKTHLLTYTKASVDLTLEPERYYMLSAPLKGMVTGDMFIPTNGNPAVFTPLDATGAPQNRFNPRIYQRLWATNTQGQPLTGGKVTVTPDETRWTPPFNALAQSLEMGKGFSLKAVKGTANSPLTFRFPKEHTEYEYVTGENELTGIKETITRTNTGHFIYEGNNFPITVTLTNDAAGTTFLAGNPFMSHIDIAAFLAENTTITSVKVYDGNTSNSLILSDGQLLTNSDAGYTKIAPMQSFFVTVAGTSASQSISYTETMLVSGAGNKLKSKAATPATEPATLKLTATAGGYASKAMLRISPAASNAYVAGEDAEVLIDNEVRPVIALFSVADGKALDIQQLNEVTEIPLGFHLGSPAAVILSVDKAVAGDWAGWSLLDAETGIRYPLDNATTTIDLGELSTNIGRFYLKNETATGNEAIGASGNTVYCTRLAAEQVLVRSTVGNMVRCEVYSAAGSRVDEVAGEASEYRLRLVQGVNIIKVYMPDGKTQVFKLACF